MYEVAADGDAPDAGAPEIEVTSEMIAAGTAALSLGDDIMRDDEGLVESIYLAMWGANNRECAGSMLSKTPEPRRDGMDFRKVAKNLLPRL